jgi:hypothetical protein
MCQRYLYVLLFLLAASLQLKSQIPNYTPNTVTAIDQTALLSSGPDQRPAFTVTPPTAWNAADGSVTIQWNFGSGTRIRAWDMHGGLRFDDVLVGGSGTRALNSGNSFQNTIGSLSPGTYTFAVYRDPFDDNLTTNNQPGGNVDDFAHGGYNVTGGDQQRAGVYSVVLLPTADNLHSLNIAQQSTASNCLSNDGSIRITGLSNGTTYEISTIVGGAFTLTATGPGAYTITGLYPGIYPVRIRVQGQTAYRLVNVEVQVQSGVRCYTDNVSCNYTVGTNAVSGGNFGTASGSLPVNGITDYTFTTFSDSDPQDSRYAFAWNTYFPEAGIVTAPTYANWLLRNFDYASRTNQLWGTMQATKDHTGSATSSDGLTNGYFLMVNANYRQDRVVSISNINIVACREYEFSCWVKNVQPYFARNKNNNLGGGRTYQPIIPRLGMVVNGIIYDFQPLNANSEPANIVTRTKLDDQGWQKIGVRFKAPVNAANSTITIYNFQQGGYGNDFAVDDIFFSEVTNPLAFSGSTAGSCGPSLTVLTTASAPCQQFGTPAYQWQVSTNFGASYTNVGASFNTSGLPNTVSATNTSPNVRYRIQITDASCTTFTDTISYMNSGGFCVLPFDGLTLNGYISHSFPELNWEVENESDVLYYELERSTDGVLFKHTATVTANGKKYYTVTDRSNDGAQFYRVRVVLAGQQHKFSNIIKLRTAATAATALEVYPNPVKETATLNVNVITDGKAELRITDQSGKVIKQQTVTCKKGLNAFTFNFFGTMIPGMYVAELSTADGTKLRGKVMVVR